MRRFLAISLLVLVAGLMPSSSTRAADDWSFVNGNYALDPNDCKLAGSAAAFSKELVDGLSQEVMTREGITSPREVHCKFRSAEKSDTGWKVQADCEEAGEASRRISPSPRAPMARSPSSARTCTVPKP